MAKITDITTQKNADRSNIFLDGKFYAGISTRLVLTGKVRIDDEIEEKELENLIFESDKDRCQEYAMDYAVKYYPSKKALVDKLYGKGYGKAVVDNAISKLEEYGYINDKQLAENLVEIYREKYGILRIKEKLYEKRIPEEISNEVLKDFENKEIALKIAKRHSDGKDLKDKKYISKLIRFLQYSGFEWNVVSETLTKLNSDIFDEGEID